ncbi:MAG: hypothetical protein Tsb0015_11070 [Simkaniaceae bacterium]
MNNKFFIFLVSSFFILVSKNIFSQEKSFSGFPLNDHYSYVKIGFGVPCLEMPLPPILEVGVGNRIKKRATALDSSLTASTLIPFYVPFVFLEGSELLLIYPKYNSPFYFGAGLGLGGIIGYFGRAHISPLYCRGKASIGTEWKNKKFIQLELSYPFAATDFKNIYFNSKDELIYFPQAQLSFGF